jgi:hypothetical protein
MLNIEVWRSIEEGTGKVSDEIRSNFEQGTTNKQGWGRNFYTSSVDDVRIGI